MIDHTDERTVRLMLSRLIEPEDQLFTDLREYAAPGELLRAILEPGVSPPERWPPGLAARLDYRRPGIALRIPHADPVADMAAGGAVGARFVIPGDADWPTALDDLGTRAPFGVWIIGHFDIGAPAVSVVGARRCTGYGRHAAGLLAADLARANATIVSGAALGIDGMAHRGALQVGGATAAVLACGIDRTYPASHHTLIQTIGQRGAILAELPPGTRPTRFRFLARNRLIAALGAGTVVVEAAERSGSLVTARLAAELGRAVFAVPGPVTALESTGTNRLLCDGAIPAVDGRQVLAELGIEAPAPPPAPTPAPAAARAERSDTPSAEADLAARLDPRAVLVREALPGASSGRAAKVLTLAAETGLAPGEVLALLGQLAAIGKAVRTGGGWAMAR
ncbi:MAG TPA: DNA-processing protein DprA [Actinospica sp.]|jgi:DNA processing protein|nr:DNA-processing protein DprA [Actinospica sp.]